jgi:hypothetical protein
MWMLGHRQKEWDMEATARTAFQLLFSLATQKAPNVVAGVCVVPQLFGRVSKYSRWTTFFSVRKFFIGALLSGDTAGTTRRFTSRQFPSRKNFICKTITSVNTNRIYQHRRIVVPLYLRPIAWTFHSSVRLMEMTMIGVHSNCGMSRLKLYRNFMPSRFWIRSLNWIHGHALTVRMVLYPRSNASRNGRSNAWTLAHFGPRRFAVFSSYAKYYESLAILSFVSPVYH